MTRRLLQLFSRVKHPKVWSAIVLFCAGVLCNFAFAPFFLYPVLFLLMLVPVTCLDIAVDTQRIRAGLERKASRRNIFKRGFRVGWLFGFGFFVGGLYWIGASFFVEPDKFLWMLPFAVTILPAGLALFWGLAFGCAALVWRPTPVRIVWLIAALCCAEWLRGHVLSGFPWNLMGYAFAGNNALIQTAYPLGIYGLSLTVWSIVLLPSASFYKGRVLRVFWPVMLSGLMWASCCLYGTLRLQDKPLETNRLTKSNVVYHLVQPNVSQKIRVDPNRTKQVLQAHIDLTRTIQIDSADGKQHLIIWGENAAPFALNLDQELRTSIMSSLPPNAKLLLGAYRLEEKVPPTVSPTPYYVFNSVYLLGKNGEILGQYDKRKLVPFGESQPFGDWLYEAGFEIVSSLPGGFSYGKAKGNGPIQLPNGPTFMPLICYEAVFPYLARVATASQTNQTVIVNLTNDAWFGTTTGPYQHFAMTRVRAVENHTPLIRVSNSGISAYVDQFGRVVSFMSLHSKGVLSIPVVY